MTGVQTCALPIWLLFGKQPTDKKQQQGNVGKAPCKLNEIIEVRGVPIHMMDELPKFVDENSIDIAALTIPKDESIKVAKFLAEHNVHGIWNFAHTDLNLPESVIVENVHLSESLMRLSYNICRYKEEHN